MPDSQPVQAGRQAGQQADRRFFGHPRGLATLFFTEMWERFSFYGMRALLVPFMSATVAAGGLGLVEGDAKSIYHIYLALVYLVSLPGGWLADRFLGQRRSVLVGGVIIMSGHISLAIHGMVPVIIGLCLVVTGTGFLKPNISTIVGQVYGPNDARRDAGFSIFYMGINIGAFLAPLVTGFLAQHPSFRGLLERNGIAPEYAWQFGFGAAAVGMFLGLIQYAWGGKHLGDAGLKPATAGDPAARARDWRTLYVGLGVLLFAAFVLAGASAAGLIHFTLKGIDDAFGIVLSLTAVGFFAWLLLAKGWSPSERKRLLALCVLFLASCVFWAAFEQAGSTLNLFALKYTRNSLLGVEFPSTWFQSVNSVFIISLAPVFAWLWIKLGRRDPSSPSKFAGGLFFAGLGYIVLAGAASLLVAGSGGRVSPLWLAGLYLCHTIGELCLSPVGLSTFSKLAPKRIAGMMLGVFFLSISVGSYMGGRIAHLAGSASEDLTPPELRKLFLLMGGLAIAAALVLAALVRPLRRLIEQES